MQSIPKRRWLAATLIGWLALAAGLASANEAALFEGEVDVRDQSEATRQAALPAALANVLVKLTGDPGIAVDAVLAPELQQAGGMLEQYRYRQDARAGSLQGQAVLIARFARAPVETLVARSGRSIWPTPRATPVVWLAIDDGRGARMLASAQAQAVAALTRQAHRRGLSLSYPLFDLEEQQRVVLSAFWAGDSAAARRSSPRYHSRVSLIGKLYRSASGWTAEWRVYDGEQLLAEAAPSGIDASGVLAAGADLVADTLGRRAAQFAADGSGGRFNVQVEDVRSAEDYVRLLQGIRRMSIVRSVQPRSAGQGSLELELDLSVGLSGFARIASSSGLLEQGEEAVEQPGHFRLLAR